MQAQCALKREVLRNALAAEQRHIPRLAARPQMSLPLEAVRIGPSRALRDTRIYELGRLNVICGRNNSGKSTVLEAVASATRRDAKRFHGNALNTFAADAGPAWVNHNIHQTPAFIEFFRPLFETKPGALWFKDEREEFLQLVMEATQCSFRIGEHWNPAHVRARYDDQFAGARTVVLVPESRTLDVRAVFNHTPDVQPDGRGLVNYLFCAKNLTSVEPARRIYEEIARAFEELSEGFRFDVVLPADAHPSAQASVSLVFSKDGDTWLPAASCGYGLRELLILLYFAIHPHHEIVCIEEPEVHLHPDMQRRLAGFWRERSHKQYFVSTHSNIFIRPGVADRVYTTSLNDYVTLDDATSRAAILAELGYDVSDNLVSDVVVLTEGPSDIPVIQEFIRQRGLDRRYRIRCWPLGGDNMVRVDLTPFLERSRVIALVDNDPGSNSARKKFVDACNGLGIPVTRLKRRAIENYFTLDALRRVFGKQIREDVQSLDPGIAVDSQIGLDPKAKNWNVAAAMSLSDIEATDLSAFLDQIEVLAKSQ